MGEHSIMGTQLSWYLPSKVIYEEFTGIITTDDIRYASTTVNQLMAAGNPPVHSIINICGVTDFPKNLEKIRRALDPEVHPHRGWLVVVLPESNVLLRLVMSHIIKLRAPNGQTRLFGSLRQAIMFLNSVDPSLNLRSQTGSLDTSADG